MISFKKIILQFMLLFKKKILKKIKQNKIVDNKVIYH